MFKKKSTAIKTATEKPKIHTMLSLTLLALVFTVALTFATIELPRILAISFSRAGWIPDVNPGMQPEIVEEFMKIARPIGYVCLAAIVILITAGFITKKKKLSTLGALLRARARTIAEVTLVHNARLLCSIPRHLQYFSNNIESASLHLFHDPWFIPYSLLF